MITIAAWAGDADLPRAKELFASHLGRARAVDVAVTPSAAYAISTVAANIQLRPGDEVLLLEEHYASVLPWQHAASSAGATIVPVPRRPAVDATPALLDAINERTVVVTAAPCGWTDGAVIDLVAVGAACRAVGAALVLDATQWVGAMPLELNAIQPDAVIVSVHKWLLGLYSFAFLWLAPEGAVGRALGPQAVGSAVPLEHHDRNRVGSDDWDNGGYFLAGGEVGFPDQFVDGAAKFDMGGRPNPVLLPPLIVGMEWLHVVGGSEQIGQILRPLTRYVRALQLVY
jgi:selenocysteine lyase/cysteine desulfurase